MIEGVKISHLKIISDDRGKIMHMIRADSPIFKKFGEIYFSTIYQNIIKGWHLHLRSTLNYACIKGKVKLVLFDDRKSSKTKGLIQEIILSNESHLLVSIPPMIWNGFCSADENIAVLANCSDIPHDKEEIIRLPFDDPKFPYKWF